MMHDECDLAIVLGCGFAAIAIIAISYIVFFC
jgi:hypothetical protein